MIAYDKEIYLNTSKKSLNDTLNELDISLVKVHSVVTHSKPALGKSVCSQGACCVCSQGGSN